MSGSEKSLRTGAVVTGLLVYSAGILVLLITGALLGAASVYNSAKGGVETDFASHVWRALAVRGVPSMFAVIAVVFTVLGGYVAARVAGRGWLRHALPVGVLSLFAGILLARLAPTPVSNWLQALTVLLPVPLALAGGYGGSLAWETEAEERTEEVEELKEVKEDFAARGASREAVEEVEAKNLSRQQQQQAQSVGQLVQQRRERDLERIEDEKKHTLDRLEDDKRRALEQAMSQSKAEACEDMRAIVREAFMSHPAATEEDFERCWPSIRDEMFKQHALRLYNTQASPTPGEI